MATTAPVRGVKPGPYGHGGYLVDSTERRRLVLRARFILVSPVVAGGLSPEPRLRRTRQVHRRARRGFEEAQSGDFDLVAPGSLGRCVRELLEPVSGLRKGQQSLGHRPSNS